MWQFITGFSIFISLLIFLILWASLVAAKKSDQKTEERYRPLKVAAEEKDISNDNQIFQLSKLSQPGKK